ncbi:MAG: hypothetical protein RL748_13 [Pseudomonadota bacterium]|jgi:post-segregation antitoxin (ccd killing protein)
MTQTPQDPARLLQCLRLSIGSDLASPTLPQPSDTVPAAATSPSWSEEHAEFVAAYNLMVENEGLALEEWRNI